MRTGGQWREREGGQFRSPDAVPCRANSSTSKTFAARGSQRLHASAEIQLDDEPGPRIGEVDVGTV